MIEKEENRTIEVMLLEKIEKRLDRSKVDTQ